MIEDKTTASDLINKYKKKLHQDVDEHEAKIPNEIIKPVAKPKKIKAPKAIKIGKTKLPIQDLIQ